jgi:hypothetical protein
MCGIHSNTISASRVWASRWLAALLTLAAPVAGGRSSC